MCPALQLAEQRRPAAAVVAAVVAAVAAVAAVSAVAAQLQSAQPTADPPLVQELDRDRQRLLFATPLPGRSEPER
jgi:hypothetical protein